MKTAEEILREHPIRESLYGSDMVAIEYALKAITAYHAQFSIGGEEATKPSYFDVNFGGKMTAQIEFVNGRCNILNAICEGNYVQDVVVKRHQDVERYYDYCPKCERELIMGSYAFQICNKCGWDASVSEITNNI